MAHVSLPNDAEAEQTMGMPISVEHRWSAEDVWALPDDPRTRYEAVDGALLMSAAPRVPHQLFLYLLGGELMPYVREHGIGCVSGGPGDVLLDPFTVVQPDLFVLPLVNGRMPLDRSEQLTPLLVIEVLSPSTARQDRLVKRPRYQRAGMTCWLVDVDSRLVEQWTPDTERPEICAEELTWHPVGASAALQINVKELFQQLFGPE